MDNDSTMKDLNLVPSAVLHAKCKAKINSALRDAIAKGSLPRDPGSPSSTLIRKYKSSMGKYSQDSGIGHGGQSSFTKSVESDAQTFSPTADVILSGSKAIETKESKRNSSKSRAGLIYQPEHEKTSTSSPPTHHTSRQSPTPVIPPKFHPDICSTLPD